MRRGVAVLAVVLAAALPFAAASAHAGAELEPYCGFVRSPAAASILAGARAAMTRYAAGLAPDTAIVLPDWPAAPVDLYLSLVHGTETRACVGLPAGSRASLGESVRALAVDVLRSDRRRPPVRADELAALRIVLAFTDAGAPLRDPMNVDPGRNGLLVSSPRGAIAFLPGEARTVRWALAEARRVGILRDRAGDATFRRLEVVTLPEPPILRHQEDDDAMP